MWNVELKALKKILVHLLKMHFQCFIFTLISTIASYLQLDYYIFEQGSNHLKMCPIL